MIRHRTAAILFSILLILGLSAIGTGRAYAAQQPARNPLYADQSAGQAGKTPPRWLRGARPRWRSPSTAKTARRRSCSAALQRWWWPW